MTQIRGKFAILHKKELITIMILKNDRRVAQTIESRAKIFLFYLPLNNQTIQVQSRVPGVAGNHSTKRWRRSRFAILHKKELDFNHRDLGKMTRKEINRNPCPQPYFFTLKQQDNSDPVGLQHKEQRGRDGEADLQCYIRKD